MEYIASKIRDLRMFPDENGRMNRSVVDAGGSVLVVSQFTLLGDVRRGRRPAFDAAESPEVARDAVRGAGRAAPVRPGSPWPPVASRRTWWWSSRTTARSRYCSTAESCSKGEGGIVRQLRSGPDDDRCSFWRLPTLVRAVASSGHRGSGDRAGRQHAVRGGLRLPDQDVLPVSGLTGNLSRIGTIGFSFGVSSIAEIQLDGGSATAWRSRSSSRRRWPRC